MVREYHEVVPGASARRISLLIRRGPLHDRLLGTMVASQLMSTTSHKSPTRILSEKAMKGRVHTSRKERDLTVDGLDKHHHEANTLKVLAKASKVKVATAARSTRAVSSARGR